MYTNNNHLPTVVNSNNEVEYLPPVENVYDTKLDPFTEVVKVPLSTDEGGYSSAFSVRLPELQNKEVGIVKKEYMAVSNLDIHKVGEAIRQQSGLQWKYLKTFFDGKMYKMSYICKDSGLQAQVPNMAVGDTIGIVMDEVNSYDGSVSAGITFSFLRLLCTNGMTSKQFGFGHTFKHTNKNLEWDSNIYQACNLLNNNGSVKLTNFVNACSNLQRPIEFPDLRQLTESKAYLHNLPTTQYGQIVRNMFIAKESNGDRKYGMASNQFTGWDLLNSGTEILTHKNKPTQGNMRNNIIMTDGMLNWGQDKKDQESIHSTLN
tara:strand:+ start:313 stop:1266 length:954 start_codon:yes stop_codon:yes gene_type:complete